MWQKLGNPVLKHKWITSFSSPCEHKEKEDELLPHVRVSDPPHLRCRSLSSTHLLRRPYLPPPLSSVAFLHPQPADRAAPRRRSLFLTASLVEGELPGRPPLSASHVSAPILLAAPIHSLRPHPSLTHSRQPPLPPSTTARGGRPAAEGAPARGGGSSSAMTDRRNWTRSSTTRSRSSPSLDCLAILRGIYQ